MHPLSSSVTLRLFLSTTGTITSVWNNALLCVLALQPAPFWSSPILPEELQCRRHRCPPQSPHHHHPITKHHLWELNQCSTPLSVQLVLLSKLLHQWEGHQHPGWQLGSDQVWASLKMMTKMMTMWCVLENQGQCSFWHISFFECYIIIVTWSDTHYKAFWLIFKYTSDRQTNLLVPFLWSCHVQLHAPSPPTPCGSHEHAPPQGHPG